jgi:phage-related protein
VLRARGPLRGEDRCYTDFDMTAQRARWTILFYRDAVGREPVREWLEELAENRPAEYGAIRHHLDLLEEFGVFLEEPYTRQLAGKLRELRPGPWRITYFCDPKRRFVLLTNFRKRQQKTEQKEIRRAQHAMRDWLTRMETK